MIKDFRFLSVQDYLHNEDIWSYILCLIYLFFLLFATKLHLGDSLKGLAAIFQRKIAFGPSSSSSSPSPTSSGKGDCEWPSVLQRGRSVCRLFSSGSRFPLSDRTSGGMMLGCWIHRIIYEQYLLRVANPVFENR